MRQGARRRIAAEWNRHLRVPDAGTTRHNYDRRPEADVVYEAVASGYTPVVTTRTTNDAASVAMRGMDWAIEYYSDILEYGQFFIMPVARFSMTTYPNTTRYG